MAKKKSKVNKSQAIRDYMEEHPEAKPAEIVDALKAKGVQLTAQYVSTIKNKLKSDKPAGKRGRPAGSTKKTTTAAKKPAAKKAKAGPGRNVPSEISLDSLIQAKGLVDAMGGIEEARKAIDALEYLML